MGTNRGRLIGPLVLSFCVGAAVLAKDQAPASGPSKRVVRFLGEPALAVLREADRVEVFRLKNERAEEGEERVGNYAVTVRGKEQGRNFAARLREVLTDEGTYVWDSGKGCDFDPGVGYRVWKGEQRIEVVLCFSCDQLVVFSPKAADGSVRSASADFDPARPALVKLAKEAFPDDPVVQALPGQRE